MLIPPGTVAVFGRTVALSAAAGRIGLPINREITLFEGNRVFPIVAEVISVAEANDAGSQQAVERRTPFVGNLIDTAPVAKRLASDIEDVEVAITPTHHRLDCRV